MTINAPSTTRAAPPPPPSHAKYILGQVRSGLAHLRATQALDQSTFEQVERLLSNDSMPDAGQNVPREGALVDRQETEEERLGKRNAWLRDTLMETSLLPTLVETAMQIAVPSAIMGDMQREAVVQLVERSQKAIARAITDPKSQRRVQGGAWTSAKGAHTGITKGLKAAGRGFEDMAQRRQESKQRSDERKAERREKKAMEKELKREREEILLQRQAKVLGGESGEGGENDEKAERTLSSSSPNYVRSSSALTEASSSSSRPSNFGGKRLTSLSTTGKQRDKDTSEEEEESDEDEDDDDNEAEPAMHIEEGAVATVSCGRVDDEEGCVTATTTFSPWPGLLLSSTIVAISDEKIPSVKEIDRVRHDQATVHSTSPPSAVPPRRVAPAPTPASQGQQVPQNPSVSSRQADPSSQSARQQIRDLPNPPLNAPTSPAPETRQSAQSALSPTSSHLPSSALPSQQSMSASAPYVPAHPDSSSPSSFRPSQPPPPARTEVKDVTEAKQKSWTRKLGL